MKAKVNLQATFSFGTKRTAHCCPDTLNGFSSCFHGNLTWKAEGEPGAADAVSCYWFTHVELEKWPTWTDAFLIHEVSWTRGGSMMLRTKLFSTSVILSTLLHFTLSWVHRCSKRATFAVAERRQVDVKASWMKASHSQLFKCLETVWADMWFLLTHVQCFYELKWHSFCFCSSAIYCLLRFFSN